MAQQSIIAVRIAARAGVSPITVHRYLKGQGGRLPIVADAIRRAMGELGLSDPHPEQPPSAPEHAPQGAAG